MADILHEIADKTKERVEEQKNVKSFADVKKEALFLAQTESAGNKFRFSKALRKSGVSFICEAKKASPSKGIIAEKFPYIEIAKDYEAAGASAMSVLTEPYYFLGSDAYLKEISQNVSLPLLRKDFTVDSYMIYEAKLLGASAVLLICSILDKKQLSQYLGIAHELGIDALVETHNDEEIKMALEVGAGIIGVNNRNLADFSVDINHSASLRSQVPENVIFVAESGIKTKEQVAQLKKMGVDAVLIGETFMCANDRRATVADFLEVNNEG